MKVALNTIKQTNKQTNNSAVGVNVIPKDKTIFEIQTNIFETLKTHLELFPR